MRKFLYAFVAAALLTVGVLANVGNAAPAKHKKPLPVPLGSGASLRFSLGDPTEVALPDTPQLKGHKIVTTGKLPAGTYELTGTFSGENAVCWLDSKAENFTPGSHQFGIVDSDTLGSGAVTGPVKVHKGRRIGLYCAGLNTGGDVLSAGITAIRVKKNLRGSVTSDLTTGGGFN